MTNMFDDLIDKVTRVSSRKKSTFFHDAPEVESLANDLIDRFPEFAHAKAANIKYLFREGNWNKLGTCELARDKWKKLTGYDYVIVIHKHSWESMNENQREALLHHELSHISFNEQTGKWAVRKHDVEEFIQTTQRYGAWTHSLQLLRSVLSEGGDD